MILQSQKKYHIIFSGWLSLTELDRHIKKFVLLRIISNSFYSEYRKSGKLGFRVVEEDVPKIVFRYEPSPPPKTEGYWELEGSRYRWEVTAVLERGGGSREGVTQYLKTFRPVWKD